MSIKNFFSKDEEAAIIQAIVDAEKQTSGEIRIHLEEYCKGDVLDCSAQIFKKLKMHKTKLRNGSLIFLAVKDRKFAILGDAGINSKVPEGFWDDTKTVMTSYFAKGDFLCGLTEGIKMIGEKLKVHFPISADDKNELSNEISFGA